MMGRIKLSSNQSWHKTPVSGQDFMSTDHWEAIADSYNNFCINTGQFCRQNDMFGHIDQAFAISSIVPVHTKKVTRIR